jgi:hypothetical protein
VPEALCYPRPLQQHVPILVGGSGEKRTLKLVARYADACNLFAAGRGGGPAMVAGKLDVLRRHCEREGTDYDAIRKTILHVDPLSPGADAGQKFADGMTGYLDLGVSEVHVMPIGVDPVAYVENLGEHVIPHLAGR